MKHCPQCSIGYPDTYTSCPTHGVLLNEIRDLKPGMIIHQSYRIVRKLGQGGMGAVYLAQHILMDEPRALKFLSPELSSDQAFTNRFLREVRVLRQIRNHNVVDCGDLEAAEDGSLFFSMEFVDGPDLRHLMNNTTGPLGDPLALSITRQIAEGLGAAHAKGMVHRDIKPENILMARDGDAWLPKIADFGIVATKESSTAYTRTGGTLLTMAYAAPEQWRGTPAAELDGRTDLYALGGVLYEMLTGRTVFHAENYEGWAEQHRNTPPQPPSALRPDLANWRGLDALVLRLLAKDCSDRPKDVAELIVLLDAVRYASPVVRQVTMPDEALPRVSEKLALKVPHSATRPELQHVSYSAANVKSSKGSQKEIPVVWQLLAGLLALALGGLLSWYSLTPHAPQQQANSATQETPMIQQQPAQDLNRNPATQSSSSPVYTKPAQVENTKPSAPKHETSPPRMASQERMAELAYSGPLGASIRALNFYNQKRYSEAAPLYDESCSGGMKESCSRLGYMYATGQGVTQDFSRAATLYSKACNAGDALGCSNLGYFYRFGRGVSQDLVMARTLLNKGCTMGNQWGCDKLKEMQ